MFTRREVLKTAAGASLFSIVPAGVLRGETAPSNQLTRALIGFGCIAQSGNHLTLKGSRLIGLLKDGDEITIDIPNRAINAKLSKKEIASRAKKAKKWSPRIKGGWLERYARFVGNASTGASLKA